MQILLNTQEISQLRYVLKYVLDSEREHYEETLETNPAMANAHIYAIAKALSESTR